MNNLKTGILIIFLICSLCIAGCVAPPKPGSSSSSPPGSSQSDSGEDTATVTPTELYVTAATPYQTETTMGQGYTSFTPSPQNTTDLYCPIYTTTGFYSYNTTAISYNLKTPPMYITFSVIPTNITKTKVVSSKFGTKEDVELSWSDYSPYSWFEVTVRNKQSGIIYEQNGFGKGYGIYLNNTIKIIKQVDLLIELKGNDITATTDVWVKPEGNFDNPQDLYNDRCVYFEGKPRESIDYATATPTPTYPGV